MARFGRKRSLGRGSKAGRRWAICGLVVFVIADLALVGWAIRSVRASPSVPGSATAATHRSATPRATPTGTPTPRAAIPDAVVPSRVLVALDDQVAWRASTGACPTTPATLELTTNGGATWKSTDASTPTSSSSVVRIMVASASEADAVTLDNQNCAPQYIGTYVSGDNWATYPGQLASSWYYEPSAPSVVHAPQGDVTTPCALVVGLATMDASHAAVLCSNHDVYRTANTGADWGEPLAVPGAVAISASANGYATAAVDVTNCAGVAISDLDGGAGRAKQVGCYLTTTPGAGAVAIASGASSLWLWAGDALARSGDGGATWH